MSHDEVIPIIQAHKEGKTIQFRSVGSCGIWIDIQHLHERVIFNFYSYDYRIKPEPPKPREYYVVTASKPSVFRGEDDALDFLQACSSGCRSILVREVLDLQ